MSLCGIFDPRMWFYPMTSRFVVFEVRLDSDWWNNYCKSAKIWMQTLPQILIPPWQLMRVGYLDW